MPNKLLCAAFFICLAAPAFASTKSSIGVSYLGSFSSKLTDEGTTEDMDMDPKGIRAMVHIQTPNYFFWGLEADFGSDSASNQLKEEISHYKIKFGGRIPAGNKWAFSPYLGGVKHEFRSSDAEFDGPDDVLEESGLLLGVGINFQPIPSLDLATYAERAVMGDFVLIDAGLLGYWHFTPALAVGGGIRHRNFDFDYGAGDKFSLDYTYVDVGLRISF